ncbi:MAG: hypothetical protein OXT67_08500 [Zetaproteobacteria bacterium]|nr:hypothetical protein [Zetaproteobacteria bacterium]
MPQYSHQKDSGIYVIIMTRPNGQYIATKFIHASADIDPRDDRLRPLIFDNIDLKGDRSLVFLIGTHGQAELHKYILGMEESIRFVDRPISADSLAVGMSNTSIPENFHYKQTFPLFAPDLDQADPGTNYRTATGGGNRIRYATTTTRFALSKKLDNSEILDTNTDFITDLLGQRILLASPSSPDTYANIIDYPYYIVYRIANRRKKHYVRTIVRSY